MFPENSVGNEALPPSDSGNPIAPVKHGRSRFLKMRKWLAWSSLTRNILASIKDGGLIAIVVALILFNEQVLDYLDDKAFAFIPSHPPIDVPKALERLNRGADTMPVTKRDIGLVNGSMQRKSRQKAMRAEVRLIRSDEAAFINDWAIVLAGRSDVAAALQEAKSVALRPDLLTQVFKKEQIRLVVAVGNSDDAKALMTVASKMGYPDATLVSLSSWCKASVVSGALIECHG
ncbi:hypothetical protein PTKU15_93100 [Paraburkholderia terrae]|nr:hypothetical protein PTKU15_93100 [Paraburkholderia terrae]